MRGGPMTERKCGEREERRCRKEFGKFREGYDRRRLWRRANGGVGDGAMLAPLDTGRRDASPPLRGSSDSGAADRAALAPRDAGRRGGYPSLTSVIRDQRNFALPACSGRVGDVSRGAIKHHSARLVSQIPA